MYTRAQGFRGVDNKFIEEGRRKGEVFLFVDGGRDGHNFIQALHKLCLVILAICSKI